MTSDADEEAACLMKWLKENGAVTDKVQWPASSTVDGVRGAVARKDIGTNEPMFAIPFKVMMAAPHASESKEIGAMVQAEQSILVGDLTLAVFVMHERGKGANSFWWPFLRSLPAPSTTLDWTDEELSLLQHDSLSSRSKSRKQRLSSVHNRVFVEHLAPRYPEIFGYVSHNDAVGSGSESSDNKGASSGKVLEAWWSLEAFEFAWGTVQARAFGKRLPWSALVPLADLLNHANLPTKYHFESPPIGEGMFRLFPSGTNEGYACGCEVFNSYGRRPNDNLMMEYGFAIEDNEHERVDLGPAVRPGKIDTSVGDPTWPTRRTLLSRAGVSTVRTLWLPASESVQGGVSAELLALHRVLAAPPHLLAEAQPPLRTTWNALGGNGSGGGSTDSKGDGSSSGSKDIGDSRHSGVANGRLTGAEASGSLLKPVAAREAKPSGVRFASTDDDVIPPTTSQPDDKNSPIPDDECVTPPQENLTFGTSEAVNNLSSELAQLRVQLAASLNCKPPPPLEGAKQEPLASSNNADTEQGNASDSDGDPGPASSPAPIFGTVPLRDAAFERIALTSAASRLKAWLEQHSTSLAEDEALLTRLTSATDAATTEAAAAMASTGRSRSGVASVIESNSSSKEDASTAVSAVRVDNDRALNSLRYRLTRKRIVTKELVSLEALRKELDRCCLAHNGDESDVAAALKAVGLPPPPVPPLGIFPAGLRPHVKAIREAFSSNRKSQNEVESKSDEDGVAEGMSPTVENLMASATDLPSIGELPKHEVGCRVELHSLLTKPKMNGKLGEVVAAAPVDGRWAVLVDGTAKPIALKPENLKFLTL